MLRQLQLGQKIRKNQDPMRKRKQERIFNIFNSYQNYVANHDVLTISVSINFGKIIFGESILWEKWTLEKVHFGKNGHWEKRIGKSVSHRIFSVIIIKRFYNDFHFKNYRTFKGSFSCKWVKKSIFFFHHLIAYAFINTHVKFQAGIRKIVEVMNFFVTSCSISGFWN